MDDRRSERFGRYEILTELGRGAMGVVYKARDPKINRVVAVKTVSLAGQPPDDEREYRERFIREAEAAGRLSHPGIVTIFDVGEEPETHAPYIVMEFVGGQSLDKLLSRDDHKLPVDKALQLALELAEALDCAHGQGVVHRDLKPANILLTEDGHAKIADFGVAKLNLANQTLGGRVLGTPAYMSPEQLNGEAVDGRSDLFSLGVVLYTILTGYRPFQGNSAVTVSFKVVNREPMPATLLNTELPQGLDYIIARAMAKDPAERYQRGMEMVLDIQELREGREPWSKAKLPGSPPSRGSAKSASERAALSLGQPWIANKLLRSALSLRWQAAAENLVEKVQKKSLTAGLVLIGFLLFGLWAISFRSHRATPRTAGPLPRAEQVTPVNAAQAPTAPGATSIASVAAVTTPVMNELAKPVSEAQIKPSSTSSATTKVLSPKVTTGKIVAATVAAAAKTAPANVTEARSVTVPAATSPATLVIEVDHKFAEAHLSIWVDDHLTYTHGLEGTDKKHLVLFHKVQGHEIHAMELPPGKHRLRAQVTSNEAGFDRSAIVAGEFASGQESVLRINFTKSGEMNLNLQ